MLALNIYIEKECPHYALQDGYVEIRFLDCWLTTYHHKHRGDNRTKKLTSDHIGKCAMLALHPKSDITIL